MASRTFNPQQLLVLQKKLVMLFPIVTFGATGAPTLQKRQFTAMGATSTAASSSLIAAPTTGVDYAVGDGVGTRSIARTGTGAYTLTLSDSYQYLLGVELAQVSNANGLLSTGGFTPALFAGTTNVRTNTARGNGGVITFILNNGSGAAADPNNGDTMTFCITLGDATEP